MSKGSGLYDQDFFLWTREQAEGLRHAKASNLPLDWENLAEEIESLGKSDRRQLASQVRRILRHLLKLEASPAIHPRAGWRTTVIDARREVAGVLRDSPSLRREVEDLIAEEALAAAQLASADLRRHDELANAIRERLEQGGYTGEQVLGDWFPESRKP
ncbi:MAG: DUF29 domain-containing protein [Alphaproteobacteria bacterium]|nr:DUF29 domain-containing protein [Alphaproteobacteria bacterium]